mmetsp:Transcript_54905/g.139157  ORF Transcript_54905/g.139157 Transcript_54905/m.139157 type:complete len:323 (-) Transcript_54905:53-1021(-)
MDFLGGGTGQLREELEAIVAGSARDTADRVALLCTLRAQAALEEDRKLNSHPNSRSLMNPIGFGRLLEHCTEPHMAPFTWSRGFFDDKVESKCAACAQPPAPMAVAPEARELLQEEGSTQDCVKILESAYAIKGKANGALAARTAQRGGRNEAACGEAFRSSPCDLRTVLHLTSQICQGEQATPSSPARPPAVGTTAAAPRGVEHGRARPPAVGTTVSAPHGVEHGRSRPPAVGTAAVAPRGVEHGRAVVPRGSSERPEGKAKLHSKLGDLQKHKMDNEELSRTLAELTAELQSAGVIGEAYFAESIRPGERRGPERWNIGD